VRRSTHGGARRPAAEPDRAAFSCETRGQFPRATSEAIENISGMLPDGLASVLALGPRLKCQL